MARGLTCFRGKVPWPKDKINTTYSVGLLVVIINAMLKRAVCRILMIGGNRMAYQMTVTLTDQEYQVLAAEAARRGEPPETLLRDLIRQLRPASSAKRPMTGRELAEKLYREGKLASLATKRSLTQEEQEERERLARLFASDKPASEMVIEDRGSY